MLTMKDPSSALDVEESWNFTDDDTETLARMVARNGLIERRQAVMWEAAREAPH